jgi:hypothetical protein
MADTMILATVHRETKLERQLRESRMDAFVGRAGQLATFDAIRYDDARSFTVLYLHGPGGIGKSTLLQRFADEAHRTGSPVRSLDVTAPIDAIPDGVRPVVLVDDLDRLENPQEWLRRTLFPAFPLGALVVVAARRPPAVAWQSDPGWNDLLIPLAVGPFSRPEADSLLSARRIPADRRAHLHTLCGGSPLALRVAAQILSADPLTDDTVDREVAHAIFDRIVGELPTPEHRQALEVSAHAQWLTEELLHAAMPDADAGTLFEWLRRRPFMQSHAYGIFPDAVVRNVVEIESRWRHHARFSAMHTRLREFLRQRVSSVSADAALPLVANTLFIERRTATAVSVSPRMPTLPLVEHDYRPGDREQVLRMARDAEGIESARLVAYWLDRQPQAFTVYRRPDQDRAVAFLCRLRLSEPAAEDLAADPVIAAAWSHADSTMPLEPGESMGIARFCVDPAAYQGSSEAMDLMRLRCAATVIRDDSLAWTTVVTPDPQRWSFLSGPEQDNSRVRVGTREYLLLSRYRKTAPQQGQWASEEPPSLSRAEFDQAVRHALRSWRRPDLLADSDLARSRIVRDRKGTDTVTDIRYVLSAALETIGSDPRQTKPHRALTATYLRGAPTQEAAAERLSLPFSTYRRHLARGLETLGDLLWKAETDGIDFTDAG